MPRQACIVIPGLAHHVTQRGNNRQDVFFVDEDRLAYLELLRQQGVRHALQACVKSGFHYRLHDDPAPPGKTMALPIVAWLYSRFAS